MISFEDEQQSGFKNFLKINDRLCPKIFDAEERMLPEVRQTLLNIAEFMNNYTANIFVNLTTTDIVLSGSMGGYTYSEDSDIDLMVLLKTDENIISAEEFEQQFIFLNSGLVAAAISLTSEATTSITNGIRTRRQAPAFIRSRMTYG